MRLSEANAVNTVISVLAGIRPYSQDPLSHVDLDEVLAAVEVLTVASWVTLNAGWDPAAARIEVERALHRQRYGVDPQTGLYPQELPAGAENLGPLTDGQAAALVERQAWAEVVIEDGKVVQGQARLAALVADGTVEVVEHQVPQETRQRAVPRLLRHATTEQLLSSRDELQAAVTAGPQEAMLGAASALRQVQVELGHRYLQIQLDRARRQRQERLQPGREHETTPLTLGQTQVLDRADFETVAESLRGDNPPPTLVVSRSSTRCSVCGKGALPDDRSHERIADYGEADGSPGCGVIWSHITSDSAGRAEEFTRALRPDLSWIDYDPLERRQRVAQAPADDESHLALKREGLL